MRLVELRRPYVALITLDGRLPFVVAGDSRQEVRKCAGFRSRLGPNGPIDSFTWLRGPS
jgi:hypothetical protein